ncbi:hypothetical protein SUGI_0728030 [Cryptomeria japonica]|nr:hypothetical protein SUGI_0728030 [Cryptomeria japonica]
MQNQKATVNKHNPSGGRRQVFATYPESITVFSPPCKKRHASKTHANNTLNARWISAFGLGRTGKKEELRAGKTEANALSTDGKWQVFYSKKTKRKMGKLQDVSLNFNRHKFDQTRQSPASGANLVPLGKIRVFKPKPEIKQRTICNIPSKLMEPQWSIYSQNGVFVKWNGFGKDIKEIIDWWYALYPGKIKRDVRKENPVIEFHKNFSLVSPNVQPTSPLEVFPYEDKPNQIRNINNLDRIIEEANSIKEAALLEMSKRISDTVDSLRSTPEIKNMEQGIEEGQEEVSSRVATVLEVFNNNEIENLTLEEEAEKRFLIQELMASMDEEDNNEYREGDIIPYSANVFSAVHSQLNEDEDKEGKDIQQTLGIKNIYAGKSLFDCAKEIKSRGRKSLCELRRKDGNAKDQGKLTAFFDAGKGKGLPTAK